MRLNGMLLAVATLAVAGCNRGEQADAAGNADTGLTAEAITANDITAIDAVTGAAANIAADVEYLEPGAGNNSASGNAAAPAANRSRAATGQPAAERPRPAQPSQSAQPEPATEPTDSNAQ